LEVAEGVHRQGIALIPMEAHLPVLANSDDEEVINSYVDFGDSYPTRGKGT
jgi:hypothetical protein